MHTFEDLTIKPLDIALLYTTYILMIISVFVNYHFNLPLSGVPFICHAIVGLKRKRIMGLFGIVTPPSLHINDEVKKPAITQIIFGILITIYVDWGLSG